MAAGDAVPGLAPAWGLAVLTPVGAEIDAGWPAASQTPRTAADNHHALG